MTRGTLLAAALAALLTGSAAIALDKPWDERVMGTPLDFAAIADAMKADPDATTRLLIERGKHLFEAKFTTLDGAGRPMATQAIVPTPRRRPATQAFVRTGGPDANACAGCHNDPVSGAAGEFVANVFVSEGFESADFDSLDPQFSNERGTNHLMGSGLVEMLAREMTLDLRAQRDAGLKAARASGEEKRVALSAKGVAFGTIVAKPDGRVDFSRLDGVDSDLTIRPFSQKGVFTSLRQFTVNALNHHHGMQPTERFGARWTGTADHDRDGMKDEFGAGDVTAMVVFQATLPAPGRKPDLPKAWAAAAARGEATFATLGCAECHRPALPLESLVFADPGPADTAGTLRTGEVKAPVTVDFGRFPWVKALPRDDKGRVLVPLFGDLKRHVISDAGTDRLGNELMAQRFVARDVFMTAELWGVGNTAPYGHRGDLTTLDEVIRAHAGAARPAREAYEAAPEADRDAVIAFLKTLVIARTPGVSQ